MRNVLSGIPDRVREWLAGRAETRPAAHARASAEDRRAWVLFLFALVLLAVSAARNLSFFSSAPARQVAWLEGDLEAGLYLLPPGTTPAELHRRVGLQEPVGGLPPENLQDHAPIGLPAGSPLSIRLHSGENPKVSAALPPRQAPLFFLPMDLNRADEEALVTIPGIGPTLAKRIVALRQEQGNFRSVEELRKVSGIGSSKINTMQNFVKVTDEL